MEQNLIAISSREVGGRSVRTVDGRELHGFLEVHTAFKDWLPRRIEEYGFVRDIDYTDFLVESGGRGRPEREYALTLDTAKELAMVERTEKGRVARRYFIACEKRLKGLDARGEAPHRTSQHQYFAVAAMCKTLDKYLGGIATARALNFFTGMPTEDLEDMIRERRAGTAGGICPEAAVDRFVSEAATLSPGGEVFATGLYRAFCLWFARAYPGQKPPTQKIAGGCFARRFARVKRSGVYVYKGIALQGV